MCATYHIVQGLSTSWLNSEWLDNGSIFRRIFMLERLVSLPGKLLVTGDFNFHINNPFDNTARQFLDLLNCFNLHVLNTVSPTHKNNNILDLIIVRTDELTALNPSVNDPVISDHFAVHCNLPIGKPQNPKMVSTTRSLHNINLQSFVQDITSSTLFNSPSSDLTELCDQYNNDLSWINMHPCVRR